MCWYLKFQSAGVVRINKRYLLYNPTEYINTLRAENVEFMDINPEIHVLIMIMRRVKIILKMKEFSYIFLGFFRLFRFFCNSVTIVLL
jgi:hypothetical protein